jgi:hypothetical protein
VSCTFTENDPDELFPVASFAVQLTAVVAIANVLPDTGEQVTTGAGSTMSVAVAEYVTTAPAALVASATIFAGTVSTGAVVSCTFTVNEPDERFPARSVAVQLTVVVAIANVLPEAGEHTTDGFGSTRSVAVAE